MAIPEKIRRDPAFERALEEVLLLFAREVSLEDTAEAGLRLAPSSLPAPVRTAGLALREDGSIIFTYTVDESSLPCLLRLCVTFTAYALTVLRLEGDYMDREGGSFVYKDDLTAITSAGQEKMQRCLLLGTLDEKNRKKFFTLAEIIDTSSLALFAQGKKIRTKTRAKG